MEDIQRETLQLIAYAKVDRDIKRLIALLEDIPLDLKKAIETLQERKAALEKLSSSLSAWQATTSTLQNEEIASKERAQELKARLQGIQNMKEYQAALKEIDDAGKKGKEREVTLSALAEQIAGAQPELETLTGECDALEKQVNESKATWEVERKGIQEEIEAKRKELEACKVGLGDTLLAKYAHIAKLREPVLATVSAGVCQECSMQLPPQQYIELQRKRAFQVCPSCQRLVYIP